METSTRIVPTNVTEDIIRNYLTDGKTMLDIKSLSLDDKVAIIKIALNCDNVTDPLMIMNLINLVKVYNTLADEYFESPDVYVNSVEELLDLKLAISKELKEFTRRISLYFLSLFKSYSKTAFTATDEHIELPKLYDTIFRAVDFLTLAGIFAKTPEISTKELVYVDNSYSILSTLLMKNNNTLRIMNQLFESQKGD